MATVLERLPGVKRAVVNRQTEEARVVYDDSRQTPEKLAAAIDRLGFQASVRSVAAAPKPSLLVDGLKDPKAARRVEAILRDQRGVTKVTVDPRTGEVFVEYEGQTVSPQQLVAALRSAGFSARPAP